VPPDLAEESPFGTHLRDRPMGDAKWVADAVTLPNEAIEIREGIDGLRSVCRLLGQHREPEPQFSQRDGYSAHVDAVEIAPQDLSPERRTPPVLATYGCKPLQCSQEECPRPNRRIEDGYRLRQESQAGITVAYSPGCLGIAEAKSCRQERAYACLKEIAHEIGGCVVGAASLPLVRVHHPLEDAAQHVRRDGMRIVALTDREVKAFKEIVECFAPKRIPDRQTVTSLEWMRLAKVARDTTPTFRRLVESPEEQRPEEISMKVGANSQVAVYGQSEKIRLTV
jgi:hypothetical protein